MGEPGEKIKLKNNSALARWISWSECHPMDQKVVGSIPVGAQAYIVGSILGRVHMGGN